MKIKKITAREILDSRGDPTIEVSVQLKNGVVGTAAVPSGASTGSHEAWELRDGDKKRFSGKGVLKAVKNVEQIITPLLIGKKANRQRDIDLLMIKLDGTPNKQRLGANAILGVSLAIARAAAQTKGLPLYRYLRTLTTLDRKAPYRLPTPGMNIVNGGVHADSGLSVQEFMIVPQQRRFAEKVRCGAEVFHALKKILADQGLATAVGDEGGFAPRAPRLEHTTQVFDTLLSAIRKAGYVPGKNVKLAIDVAASELYNKKTKQYLIDGGRYSAAALMTVYQSWQSQYPLMSIEDGCAEDDWAGWELLTKQLKKKLMLVGDDLFVTNPSRLEQGIARGVANAVLIKVNQIGTLSETLHCISLAQHHGYQVMVSHRSGETPDDFIADLAVAVNAEYIKAGSLSRGERLAKYNRLMAIAAEVNG
ncbi:MAG: phosphopyruvate hydratase [Patescibacteria group bacterium]